MKKKETDETRTLDEYGIIFLSGEINQEAAEETCRLIIEFNVSQTSEFIQLIINSAGGICSAGFAIIDMMDWSDLPVYTTGVGIIGSMALGVFMAGEKRHRVLTPHTSVLSHRFSSLTMGNHSELVARRREEDMMHKRLIEHYLRHSALETVDEVEEKLLRDVDTWLSPREAVDFGMADLIQESRKPAFYAVQEVR